MQENLILQLQLLFPVTEHLMYFKSEGLSNCSLSSLGSSFSLSALVDGVLLFVHDTVKRFMKVLSNIYSSLKDLVPSWDSNLALSTFLNPWQTVLYFSICKNCVLAIIFAVLL